MVKENLRTKTLTLRLPNSERIQYTYFNQAHVRITIQNGSSKAFFEINRFSLL